MAGAFVAAREEFEDRGLTFMGSVSMAAKSGYLTPRALAKAGRPATPEELAGASHFAMMPNCDADLRITGGDGRKRRPCIPVLFWEDSS